MADRAPSMDELARAACEQDFQDCCCLYANDGPCGRCGPVGRLAAELIASGEPDPGKARAAAVLARGREFE